MARPIVIEFAANVRDFLRGTRDVERATEDIADELKDATRDAERFEREFEQSMRDAERAADNTSRGVKQDFSDMPDALGEIGEDAGSEMVSNLGEAVSSGDIEGVLQGILGGVVGGLKGPLGIAAAGLAGVGVIAFQQIREEADRMAAWAESWAEGFREQVAQARDELKAEDIQAGFEQWLEDNQDSFLKIHGDLEQLGIDADLFARALYAGGEPAEKMLAQINAAREGSTRLEEVGGRLRPVYDDSAKAVGRIQTEMLNLIDTQDDVIGEQEKMADFLGEDLTQEVLDYRRAWAGVDDDLEKIQVKRVIVETEVRGPGAAYVDPPSSPSRSSPSNVATRNRYTSGSRAR